MLSSTVGMRFGRSDVEISHLRAGCVKLTGIFLCGRACRVGGWWGVA